MILSIIGLVISYLFRGVKNKDNKKIVAHDSNIM